MILNVLIGGISIGLAKSWKEAEDWLSSSRYEGKKEVVVMRP